MYCDKICTVVRKLNVKEYVEFNIEFNTQFQVLMLELSTNKCEYICNTIQEEYKFYVGEIILRKLSDLYVNNFENKTVEDEGKFEKSESEERERL